ncbi:hypothetical protein ABPG77_004203 [Micractinium sp. CCAP 211/92]
MIMLSASAILHIAAILPLAEARQLHQSPAPPSQGGKWPDPSLADSFVTVQDGDFVLGCQRFPISGWNQWEVMEAAAGAPRLVGSVLPPGQTGPEMVRALLDTAAQSGLTVVRAWAHGVSPSYPVQLDNSGSSLNEGMLKGLDYFLSEAGKRGLKVILSCTSNWTPAGGVDYYANATGLDHNAFFSSPAPKALFKKYIAAIVGRKSTITGRAYSEDPTIMAWDLINEPVCRDCPPGTIAGWVREMAAYVKGLDSKHLLTVGEEGFYSTTKASVPSNPGYPDTHWAEEWNQDFVVDHSDPNIDFAAMHIWPDLWKCQTCSSALPVSFFQAWIQQHIKDAASLGKPLIIEEFGTQQAGRDAYFSAAFQAVEASLRARGPLKGALFWQLYAPGQTASAGEGGGAGQFGIYPSDATFKLVQANAAAVQQLAAGPPLAQCSPGGPSAAPACADKGYEGPACDVDVDECVRGTAGCAATSICLNSPGSFECVCPLGTTGAPLQGCANDTGVFSSALAGFHSDPKGQACDQGRDIPYPHAAVGWAEDPTGGFDRNPAFAGGAGARLPVSLAECAVACIGAPGCDMFTYNPAQQGCFLKSGQCPLRNDCQPPPLTCWSVSDTGKNITTPCGTWTTYYRQQVWDTAQQYCQQAGAGQATGGRNGTQVAAYSTSPPAGGR